MKTALFSVLLVTLMLVSPSEQGWRFRRASNFIRKYDREIAAGLTLARAFGKRAANRPPPCPAHMHDGARMTREEGQHLLEKLHLTCPEVQVTPEQGLSQAAVISAFDATNVNHDKHLDKDELLMFETVLDAFKFCLKEDEKPQGQ